MKNDVLEEMKGGVFFSNGRPWWFVLGDDIQLAEPGRLASQLFAGAPFVPEVLAKWLGVERFFPLTQGKLGKWSLELRRRHLSSERLPSLKRLKALARSSPIEAPELLAERVANVWSVLAPLLGREMAFNCAENMLVPWRLWEARKPWHETGHRTLQDLMASRGYNLKHSWTSWTVPQRIELFLSYMGPGTLTRDVLLEAANDSSMSDSVREMTRIWAGALRPPGLDEVQANLHLALKCPHYRLPLKPLHPENLERLLNQTSKLRSEKLDVIVELGQIRQLPVDGILNSKLAHDDIAFALDNRLDSAILCYNDPDLAKNYFDFCRLLLEAGLPSRLLSGDKLLDRAGNRYIFSYLLIGRLTEPLGAREMKALDSLAPGVGFAEDWTLLPSLDSEALDSTVELADKLGLDRDSLLRFCRLRMALGKDPLTKRLRSWTDSQIANERMHLEQVLQNNPEAEGARRRLESLKEHYPDKSELKRCWKEVSKGLEKHRLELWAVHLQRISEKLLKVILGSEILSKTPRAARFLGGTDLAVDKLLLLRAQHPANHRWLESYERGGRLAAYWLDGVQADFVLDGKFIELRTERLPSEVLEMGTHFDTCLSLDGGMNAFSTLTNLLEVNKMILLGRDLSGKVMVRKMLGLTLKGELVGYQTYSHLQGAKEPLDRACREFARKCDLELSNSAKPERIIHELDWYDDGPEVWLDTNLPDNLPEHWPRDRDAVRQWLTLEIRANRTPPRFQAERSVELYHLLDRNRRLDMDPDSEESWRWDEALEAFAIQDRFDILTTFHCHNTPSEMIHLLSTRCGLTPENADDYVNLLNPEHKLYRKHPVHPRSYDQLLLSPVSLFANPKEWRATCQGLANLGALQKDEPFFEQLVEILILALTLKPEAQGWHRFFRKGLESLMVAVGCRLSVPQWSSAFKKITELEPDYDDAWLARARAEGPALAPLLTRHLARRRKSLPLALALHHCGVVPEQYILPRPGVLCRPDFLNKARALRFLIEPRLRRLKSKGYNSGQLRLAESSLQPLVPSEYRTWLGSLWDSELDIELSKAVLRDADYSTAAAWARLGDSRIRVGILWHLQAVLDSEQTEFLAELAQNTSAHTTRDVLPLLWLDQGVTLDEYNYICPETILAWRHCPFEVEAFLSRLYFDDKLRLLQYGAEWLEQEELSELVEVAFPTNDISLIGLSSFLQDEANSVVLQEMLLAKAAGEPPYDFCKTTRGQWADQRRKAVALKG